MTRPRFSVRSFLALVAILAAVSMVASRFLARSDGPILTTRLSRTYAPGTALQVWQIDDCEYGANDDWFSDLTHEVYALDADKAPRDGTVIGRYTGAEPFSRRHLEWLIKNGYPNANLHVIARVALMKEADDADGRCFWLISEDDYWTVSHYRKIYDFVVHVDHDGIVRLMNPLYYR